MPQQCTICQSQQTHILRMINQYRLIRCGDCRIVFIHPQPPQKKILEHNAARYDSKETMALYRNMENTFFKRARTCVDVLNKGLTFSGKRLLDVGCSAGYYLKIFQDAGFSVQGIDISPLPVEYAKRHYRVAARVMSLDELPDRPAQYDVITLFDVIEHLPDPAAALKKLHHLLKPRGILLLQTPNIDSLIARLTGSRWYWLLVPQHLFLFSPESMKCVLQGKNAPFEILKLQTWDDMYEFWSNILTIIGLPSTGNHQRLHRRIVRILEIVTAPFSQLWNLFGYGGEMVVYARKK